MRTIRLYRIIRVLLTIAPTALRYLWLMARERVPGLAPSEEDWNRAHERTGSAIFRLATSLGGIFIKVGQVLGARADAFPEAFVRPLRELHDKVPARPFSELREHVERELGRRLDEVFAEVREEALAAASLAQVHRARLRGGEEVVIKVQYPEAHKLFPVDIGSLRRAARVVSFINRRLNVRPLAAELTEYIGLELDFSREAESTERVTRAFAGDPRVRIPRVHREFSSSQLLVLEYLDGIQVTDVDRLRASGVDLPALAEQIAGIYGTMLFEHGFFHGDPHPGNLLSLADGSVGLLDFGMAKELPPGFAAGMGALIASVLSEDGRGAMEAARKLGFKVASDDPEAFLGPVRLLLGQAEESRHLRDLLDSQSFAVFPSHFTLVMRVFVLLSGLSHVLAPGEPILPMAMARALGPHLQTNAA